MPPASSGSGRSASASPTASCFINIDHHESNTRYGDLNWVSAREPSTGELIFRLLEDRQVAHHQAASPTASSPRSPPTPARSNIPPPAPAPITWPANWSAAAPTWRRSATRFTSPIPLSRARLLRHVYSHFRLTHDDQIAYFWLKKADFARTGADSSDSEGLIDHIRAIAPVVVACVFEEIEPELTRISLRSKSDKVNVNEIAAQFGGGGHPAAAGARIPGKPLSVQRKVIAAVKKALNSAH